ncbi:MAG: DUF2520 domain-containing protein [Lachnospiraceae bacterium]|nr:DUF2520 domain-containing protein [Lachnospiraceae bacterium]
MKTGFIGAGRVGFSLGKYLVSHRVTVSGYYDHTPEHAAQAAEFTGTKAFRTPGELTEDCDLLFLTTPDGVIRDVWDEIRDESVRKASAYQDESAGQPGAHRDDIALKSGVIRDNVSQCMRELSELPLAGKIICHCSGSLTSEIFEGIRETGAVGCSLHPMLAFSDRYESYRQLENAFFTVEGDERAVAQMTELFESLGNRVCPIEADKKALYHTAASVLSNQVVAVLDTGYRLLMQCGFSEEEARSASERLVRGNVDHVIRDGCVQALTGPIERGDAETVRKHLGCLEGEDRRMYRVLGRKLTEVAQAKHPEKDYGEIGQILHENVTVTSTS